MEFSLMVHKAIQPKKEEEGGKALGTTHSCVNIKGIDRNYKNS